MGGVALKNGLVLLTDRNWAAAIREADGSISVAGGKKPRLPGSGEARSAGAPGARRAGPGAGTGRGVTGSLAGAGGGGPGAGRGAAAGRGAGPGAGIPIVRGLGRFGESLLVLAAVKAKLPHAELPFESGRVAAALGASFAATSAVRAAAPKSAVVQEVGTALASFVPAVFAVKSSTISGYHGAEHKVIGGREAALRAAEPAEIGAVTVGDSAAAAKEHDRCGSNLIGPYLVATIITNLLARGRSGVKTPAAQAAAGAASLGLALEAMRWAGKHRDSRVAKLMLLPGRALQKSLTTTEPTPEQLEVGERALAELLRLENAGA
jgi:hypothetical protein